MACAEKQLLAIGDQSFFLHFIQEIFG